MPKADLHYFVTVNYIINTCDLQEIILYYYQKIRKFSRIILHKDINIKYSISRHKLTVDLLVNI